MTLHLVPYTDVKKVYETCNGGISDSWPKSYLRNWGIIFVETHGLVKRKTIFNTSSILHRTKREISRSLCSFFQNL